MDTIMATMRRRAAKWALRRGVYDISGAI